jgi:hypothetical protein
MTTVHAPPRAASSTRRSKASPAAFLVEPSVVVSASLLGLLEPQGYEVCIASDPMEALDDATLVVVEADRGARTIALIKRLSALRPDLPIVAVLPWWNDDEAEIVRVARFILHVPVRDDQLQGLADLAAALLRRPAPIAL